MTETVAVPVEPASGERHPEIDWTKAAAIATVVLIHSLPEFYAARIAPAELWLNAVARFAVPGFLAASGFLYAAAGSHALAARTGRRLRRLLLPYVVFSLLAQGFRELVPPVLADDSMGLVEQLLFGAALGPYYYVFVIFWLILATPLIARIPRPAFPFAVVAALAIQGGLEMRVLPDFELIFWAIRNPFRWLATFLVGWWIFDNLDAVRRTLLANRRAWLASVSALWLAGAFALAQAPPGRFQAAISWLQIYASLGFIFVAAVGRPRVPAAIRWLSDASYSIYLSHLFFLEPVLRAIPRVPGVFAPGRILAAWAAGLAGGAALAALAQRLLGARRARAWFG